MLTCREFAHRHASDYIDRQLGWRASLGVRLHLLVCEHCRRFVGQLRKVRSLLRDKPSSAATGAATAIPDNRVASENQALGEHLADLYRQQKNATQKKSSPPL